MAPFELFTESLEACIAPSMCGSQLESCGLGSAIESVHLEFDSASPWRSTAISEEPKNCRGGIETQSAVLGTSYEEFDAGSIPRAAATSRPEAQRLLSPENTAVPQRMSNPGVETHVQPCWYDLEL